MEQNTLTKKREPLVVALLLSVILNVFLFVLCFYEEEKVSYKLLKNLDKKPYEVSKKYENISQNLRDILFQFQKKSVSELLLFLKEESFENKESATFDGYTTKDIALGVLISLHHLNYRKPLSGDLAPKEERVVKIEEDQPQITLLPGLTFEQSLALKNFVNEEQCPFTAKGIFNELRKNPYDENVKKAFFHTEEFMLLETLLSLAPGGVSYDEICEIAKDGSFEILQYHTNEIKKTQDFGEEKRRKFLTSYLDLGSKTAAIILLRSDFQYASKRLNDPLTMTLLSLGNNSPLIKRYALTLLSSPRRSEVWFYAQKTLSVVLNKPEISTLSRKDVLNLFGLKAPSFSMELPQPAIKEPKAIQKNASTLKPTEKSAAKSPPKKQNKNIPYIIQHGDNLWKLARKFNSTVKEIEQANNLTSHDLKPGTVLLIPRKG